MLDFGAFILSRLFYRSLSKFNRNDLNFSMSQRTNNFFLLCFLHLRGIFIKNFEKRLIIFIEFSNIKEKRFLNYKGKYFWKKPETQQIEDQKNKIVQYFFIFFVILPKAIQIQFYRKNISMIPVIMPETQKRMQKNKKISRLFYFLFQNMSSRISGTLQTPPQIFMRIIPRFVGSDIKGSSLDATGYRLFLQRGLQVMGKSLPVQAPKMGKRSEFSNGDKFDFQIINDKNLDYMFALYSIDEVGNEERIQSVAFNAKSYYNSFIQSGKAQFRQQIRFPHQKIALQIIILINNVIQSLARLTEGILPKPVPPVQQQPLNEQTEGKIQKSQGKFFNVNSFSIGKVEEMLPDESNGPAIEEQIGEEKARTKKLMFNTPETAFESQEIQNLPKIEGSSKMGKITLIVVALLILVVLIGGGVIPSFNKKGKKKSKNKKSSMF